MSDLPVRPEPRQLAVLTPLERAGFRLADFMARRLPWVAELWNATAMRVLTDLAASRRLRVAGLRHLERWGPQDRLVLVANHRSFFDFFQVMNVVIRHSPLWRRVFFPVRGNFFYDHPLGPVVNLAMSGMRMFPPIIRRRQAHAFNEYALDRCVAELARPGTVLGIHPEGTRNKGPDPYKLLRATRGVGRIALQAQGVQVVPVFVLGAGNNIAEEFIRNFRHPERHPLYVVFGPPVNLDDLRGRGDDPAAWKEAARRCMDAIEALGQIQQELVEEGWPPGR